VRIERLCFLLLVLLCNRAAFAEGGSCPQGYFPTGGGTSGFSGCAPMNNAGSANGGQGSASLGPLWQTRWGAIAVDGQKGRFGGVEGLPTSRKAKQAAINECRKNGGSKCKVLTAYWNQCGALVWGDDKYSGHTGSLADEVMGRAVESCSKATSNCQIYYSGCSYPERVQ
jgi:Domain of unknown function (DUF4189)